MDHITRSQPPATTRVRSRRHIRRRGLRTSSDSARLGYREVSPTREAGASSAAAFCQLLAEAGSRAREWQTERALPALSHTTPHALRRTYA